MQKISNLILSASIGFYGMSIANDSTELLIAKSKVFFSAVVLAAILNIVDSLRRSKN